MKKILLKTVISKTVVEVDDDNNIIPGTEKQLWEAEDTELCGPGDNVYWPQGEWPDSPGEGIIVEVHGEETTIMKTNGKHPGIITGTTNELEFDRVPEPDWGF